MSPCDLDIMTLTVSLTHVQRTYQRWAFYNYPFLSYGWQPDHISIIWNGHALCQWPITEGESDPIFEIADPDLCLQFVTFRALRRTLSYLIGEKLRLSYWSHTRTVVRECFKVNGKGQNSTLATPKPLNRSSPKLARVITSWTAHDMQNFCSDRFRGFCSPNTWFCRAFGVTSFFFVFWVLQ